MGKISDNNLKVVSQAATKMGYTIQKWGQPDSSGYYRPQAICEAGKIRDSLVIRSLGDGSVLLYDHAARVKESMTITVVDTPGEIISSQESAKEIKDLRGEKLKIFTKNFDDIPNKKWNVEHPVGKKKKIKLVNSFVSNGTLYVPYYDQIGGPPIAAQKRYENGGKFSVEGSSHRGVVNVLSEGVTDPSYGTRLGYLSESYTTACEILEACPDAFVACCIGLNQLISARNKVMEMYPDLYPILVCDKPKHNKMTSSDSAVMEAIVSKTLPYIKLDAGDPGLNTLTDFNDYALKYGKFRCRKEIIYQTQHLLPHGPEVINQDFETYSIVSPKDGLIHDIKKNSALVKHTRSLANKHFWHTFQLANIGPKADLDKFIPDWLQRNANKNMKVETKGQGIFREGNYFVSNILGDKMLITDNKMIPSDRLRVAAGNIYTKTQGSQDQDISRTPLKSEHLDQLGKVWGQIFDLSEDHMLGLMGWAIQACYADFSPFRTHMWLEGPTGSGKSVLQLLFYCNLFKGLVYTSTDATKAGLGQMLTTKDGVQNSPFVMIDECGDDTREKREKANDLINLSRSMATASEGNVSLRGTSDQSGHQLKTRCCLSLSSRKNLLKDPQDIARFIVINMSGAVYTMTHDEHEEVAKILQELNPMILNRVILMAPKFNDIYSKAFNLISAKYSSRYRELSHKMRALASCLAGAACLLYNGNAAESVKIAFKNMESFLDTLIHNHFKLCGVRENISTVFTNFRFRSEASNLTPLLDALKTDPDNMWNYYGIRINNVNIYVNKTDFKLHSLMGDRNLAVTEPIVDIEERLLDAKASKNITSKQIMINKERIRVYVIPIPKELI